MSIFDDLDLQVEITHDNIRFGYDMERQFGLVKYMIMQINIILAGVDIKKPWNTSNPRV